MPDDRVTVFIVDDDDAVRQSLVWMLAGVDLAGDAFASAEAFLASVTAQRRGCLLVDLHLPGLSGAALLDALDARGFSLPVIVISGDVAVADIVGTLQPRVFGYLRKPCSEHALLTQIRAALTAAHRIAH
ncbi:MAG: response regulator [bacterium]